MNEFIILFSLSVAIIALVSFAIYVQVIGARSLSAMTRSLAEATRIDQESAERLKQHLISMDLYNKAANKRSEEANKRQEKWFRELGYNDRRILEIIDEPEED